MVPATTAACPARNISLGARIIAVADRLDELTHDSPGVPARTVPEAIALLSKEPLDQDVVERARPDARPEIRESRAGTVSGRPRSRNARSRCFR